MTRCAGATVAFLVVVVAVMGASCDGIGRTPAPVTKVEEPDTWSRSLQCADHADRLLARMERTTRGLDGTNHYNSKDRRCYLETTSPDAEIPNQRWIELYDAVENRVLAMWTLRLGRPPSDLTCLVTDSDGNMKSGECAAVQKFIREKMTQ